ncbi:MAG: DUF99 family protein, partial [Chitinivibrionales bacterium]|nr:DUF99 family protein [Chitinivibrionales bacterium]
IVGSVFAGTRLDGVLVGQVTPDGDDAADEIIRLVRESPFVSQLQLILVQGVTLGGFNVVDLFAIHERLGVAALAVCRRRPDREAVRAALDKRIANPDVKWRIIERLGPMEPAGKVFVQRVGLTLDEATAVIERLSMHGSMPEPLRVSHLVAGALVRGHSHGRA